MTRVALNLITGDPGGEGTRQAVESARFLCDELVIVSTAWGPWKGPALELAGLPVKLVHRPWDNDFSAARNAALDATSADVVLVLDDDEVLVAGSDQLWFIYEGLRKPREPAGRFGFALPIVGIDGVVEVPLQLRAFPRGELRWTRRAHNQLETPDREPVGNLFSFPPPAHIRHKGYTPELIPAKVARGLRLLALDLEAEPDNGQTHYYLAREYARLHRIDEARRAAEKALELSAADTPARRGLYVPGTYAVLALVAEDEIKRAAGYPIA